MARRPTLSAPPRGPWAWAALGIAAGLLLALLVFAPASWLAGPVARASNGHLVLSDPRGTVWNGSAQLMLSGGAGSSDAVSLPTRVDWRLGVRWNGLAAQVQSACCTAGPVTLRLRPRWGGAHLDVGHLQASVPASLLAGLGTPWNTLQMDGDLRLSSEDLSVEWTQGRLAIAGQAELTAQRMSSRLSTLRPMGSYRITVLGGATPALQLATLEGALRLEGAGQWVGSRLRFSGTASAAPESEAALANLLNIIGRRSGPRSIITIG
ncbi:type II secretion system protein N [Caenimonas aquaedulcis]|uniref:Type II secretion system protein N n=1 Tax=Caenimonas aquaedulcis TaxID=2793270 RepID=A0A931H6H6_9BURK|nr:type II secretion system protein N [Caenimonas aquaedulcis]